MSDPGTVEVTDPASPGEKQNTLARGDSGLGEDNGDSNGSEHPQGEEVTSNGPKENEAAKHPSETEREDSGFYNSKDAGTPQPSISAIDIVLKAIQLQEDREFHGFITIKYTSCPAGGPLPPPDPSAGDTSEGKSRVTADSDTPHDHPYKAERTDAILLAMLENPENPEATADGITIVEMPSKRMAADGGGDCRRVRYYTAIKQKAGGGQPGERDATGVLQISPFLTDKAKLAGTTRRTEKEVALELCDGTGKPGDHSAHLVANGNSFVGVNKRTSKLELLPVEPEVPLDMKTYLVRVTVNNCETCSKEHKIAIYWSDSGSSSGNPAQNFYLDPIPETSKVRIKRGPGDRDTISKYRLWRDRL